MLVLMRQTARQYTPNECSVKKSSYMSVYQQDLLDSLQLVFIDYVKLPSVSRSTAKF